MNFDLDRRVSALVLCPLFASSVDGGQHSNTNSKASDGDEISSSNSISNSATHVAMQHRQQANTGQYILLMERRLLSYW
jgi:hypothetical protein